MEKLMKIQAELKAPKNLYNKFGNYSYRSCESILEALKPLLIKYKCSLILSDEVKQVGDIVFIESTATLSDEETKGIVKFTKAQAGINPDKKGMDIAQSFGASSSYARKYALNGLFMIDDNKDADDTNTHGKAESQPEKQPKGQTAKPALIPKTDLWAQAVEKLAKGKTSYDVIQNSVIISDTNMKQLIQEVDNYKMNLHNENI
jgi:hypothetical protein